MGAYCSLCGKWFKELTPCKNPLCEKCYAWVKAHEPTKFSPPPPRPPTKSAVLKKEVHMTDDRDFYCSTAGVTDCPEKGNCQGCPDYHRKWPTPEQFQAEYGREYPDDGAMYLQGWIPMDTQKNSVVWSMLTLSSAPVPPLAVRPRTGDQNDSRFPFSRKVAQRLDAQAVVLAPALCRGNYRGAKI